MPRSDEALDALAAWQAFYAATQSLELGEQAFLRIDKMSVGERMLQIRLHVSRAGIVDGIAAAIAGHPYFRARAANLNHMVHQGSLNRLAGDSGHFGVELKVPFRAVEARAEGKPPLDPSGTLLPHEPLARALAEHGVQVVREGAERRNTSPSTGLTTATREVVVGATDLEDLIAALHGAQEQGYHVVALRWTTDHEPRRVEGKVIRATFTVQAVAVSASGEGLASPPHDMAALWQATALSFDHLTKLERIQIRAQTIRLHLRAPDVARVDAIRAALATNPVLRSRALDPERSVEVGRVVTEPTGNVSASLHIRLKPQATPEPVPSAGPDPLPGNDIQTALRASKLHAKMISAMRRDPNRHAGHVVLSRDVVTTPVDDAEAVLAVLGSLQRAGWQVTEARWTPGKKLSVRLAIYEALAPADAR